MIVDDDALQRVADTPRPHRRPRRRPAAAITASRPDSGRSPRTSSAFDRRAQLAGEPDPLARRRHGGRGRTRGRASPHAAASADAGDGRTGVRPVVVETYAALLNAGITPRRPRVRLSRLLRRPSPRCRTWRSPRWARGGPDAAVSALPAADASPPPASSGRCCARKEGLALINGTDGMLGMLLARLHDLEELLTTADVAAAISIESQRGRMPSSRRPHGAAPAARAGESAANLRAFLAGSPIVASHRGPECTRVQDAYSLRCAPQVHGAARDRSPTPRRSPSASWHPPSTTPSSPSRARRVERQLPRRPGGVRARLPRDRGADVASMSVRRTDRALDVARSNGLPPFLADEVASTRA